MWFTLLSSVDNCIFQMCVCELVPGPCSLVSSLQICRNGWSLSSETGVDTEAVTAALSAFNANFFCRFFSFFSFFFSRFSFLTSRRFFFFLAFFSLDVEVELEDDEELELLLLFIFFFSNFGAEVECYTVCTHTVWFSWLLFHTTAFMGSS